MTQSLIRVASIGECMIELRQAGPKLTEAPMAFAYGGDTLNMATYLARWGRGRIAVDYLTALGDDPFSDAMVEGWRQEGIGTDLVLRLPDRLPGLYAIRTDDRGERRFYYWRSAAAAREMLKAEGSERIVEALPGFDLVYLSGITLSILDQQQRNRLFDLLDALKQRGGKIAFDSNYRPRGWPDQTEAARLFTRAFAMADFALPTLDDEQTLFGDADAASCARRIRDLGASEVAVKMGEEGCFLLADGVEELVPADKADEVADTTAAGDSFNAGYLAARLAGRGPVEAARAGAQLAAVVVQHPGAIIPDTAMPRLPN